MSTEKQDEEQVKAKVKVEVEEKVNKVKREK